MNYVLPTADSVNLYRGSPRQVKYWIMRCLKAGLVPMVQGPPAVGKSAMIRSIAKAMNCKLIDDRVATNGPEHYLGIPDVSGEKSVYKPFDVFPLAGDPLPRDENGDEMEGWVIFQDEFNSGLPTTMVAAYKFFLEREIGGKKLHEKVHIVCAGNRDEDRAIVQALGTAMQSRLIWLEMYLDGNDSQHFEEFMEDVAMPNNWDSRIISFLYANKGALNAFDPNHTEKTFSAPRTLDFLQRLITGEEVVVADGPLYGGAIGSAWGAKFVSFVELFDKLPKLDDIIKNPLTAMVPADPSAQWATISMLVNDANEPTLGDIGDYVEKYQLEFRILFWRLIQKKQPALRRTAAFKRAQTSMARYLYAQDD